MKIGQASRIASRSVGVCNYLFLLFVLVLHTSPAISEVLSQPGIPDPLFSQTISGSFSPKNFEDLVDLMETTAVPVRSEERTMICEVLQRRCAGQNIYRSAVFTGIFFFLHVEDGTLINLSAESVSGTVFRLDLTEAALIEFSYANQFGRVYSCGNESSLAMLGFTDSQGRDQTIFAFSNAVGCPDEEPLRAEHRTIPLRFKYLSVDGATGYSSKE